MLLVTPDGTGQTRMVGMGAPDTSGIDLDPANFRGRADLVYCLRQLHVEAGRPSYSKLNERAGGNKLPPSTLSDLIGEKAQTRSSQPEWDTVRLFVLACGVPETELDGWWKAWKLAVAPDRPAWQEEQQHLLAKIDQLTTDLAAAEARTGQLTTDLAAAKAQVDELTADLAAAEACTDQLAAANERIDQLTAAVEAAEARAEGAEAALVAYHQSQSAALCLPEPLERLRIKADIHREAGDYAAAIDLYSRIARHVKCEHVPGDPRTLQAQHEYLEVKTEALESRRGVRFRVFARHTLDARWRKLICAHQRWLPEGGRTTLELRLDHVYWVAILLRRRRNKTTSSPSLGPSPLTGSPAHKLLIDLYADCKIFIPRNDLFTEEVFQYMHTEESEFKHPQRHRRETRLRLRRQARGAVFLYG